MNKKKIVHVIDEFKPGGAQTHLVTILKEMHRRDDANHEVWCLLEDGHIGDQLRYLSIPTKSFDLRELLQKKKYLRIISKLRREILASRPDVIEAHLTWSRLFCSIAGYAEGVPIRIGFEHGDIYMSSRKFRLANFTTQFLFSKIIVCSNALKQWVINTHFIAAYKLLVLHNCVDTIKFNPMNRKQRESNWPNAKTLFCSVGTLGNGVNKRMDICIRAIALARENGADIGLLICGDGNQRGDLEMLIKSLHVEDHIKILGMRDDINFVIASCDAFCHAAPFEPFGIVCIEAMASGIPVVIPNSGGIAEIVKNGVNGFTYCPLDYHELASCMVKLSSNQADTARMSESALETVMNRFTVENYVNRIEPYYGLGI
jgi:glycosyltransferase involved in cell wall biosynthesis